MVILSVIPPGLSCWTERYQPDGITNLICEDGTAHYVVDGWDPGPLGRLYRPRYFNGGIAVHGYPSVPSTPASHGCVRVTLGAMDHLWSSKLLPIGRTVIVR